MLGYVKAYKPDLRVREYELYKGIYCSLCRALGRKYSPLAQLLLSYDITFFALIRLGVTREGPHLSPKRCPYNPAKKCMGCSHNAEIDFSADVVILMVYYKLRDNLADGGFFEKLAMLLLYPLFALLHRKAAKSAPRAEEIIRSMMQAQAQTEAQADVGIDAAAHASAHALGQLLQLGEPRAQQAEALYRLGYCTGRWVYITDAVDDLPKDRKTGGFNALAPLATRLGEEAFYEKARQLLHISAGEAAQAFERLESYRFSEIISNIVYDGMAQTIQAVCKSGGEDIAKSV